MLDQEQIDSFHRNGFVLGWKVADDAFVEELRAEMARVIAEKDRNDIPQPVMLHNMGSAEAQVWQIVNISDASPAFRRLVCSPDLAKTLSDLMHAGVVRLWHDQVQYKPAAVGGVNKWHQDAPYWPSITPDDQVTAWVALDDVDADNGCMSMVPGSHLWGNNIDFIHTIKDFDNVPAKFDSHDLSVKLCPVKKGYVHFHHALTWHGSGANKSGRPRRAVALHFMSGDTRFVASGGHPMNKFITAKDGESVKDDHFVKVWPTA
jgi:ectoine hydroxylase-related dioxygenase (phytanoyl-CoA dioxygenase family)